FESALEVGDSIISIVSPSRRQALEAQLVARGFDLRALAASGRYAFGDNASALDAILRDGVPDRDLYFTAINPLVERGLAAATGAPAHVSIFGEIAPILCDRGDIDAMRRLEQIATEYIATRPVSILCGYSVDCLADEAAGLAVTICAEHCTIVPGDLRQ